MSVVMYGPQTLTDIWRRSEQPAFTREGEEGVLWGFVASAITTTSAWVESVDVIQHGDGAPQTLSLRGNTDVDVFDDWIHYTSDTSPRSSGSPVLNDQWQLVPSTTPLSSTTPKPTERSSQTKACELARSSAILRLHANPGLASSTFVQFPEKARIVDVEVRAAKQH